jgi:hypothetical protein
MSGKRKTKKRKTVKVAVRKDSGLRELLGVFVQAGTSSGKPHVLQRATSKRYPIHIKYGPSVPEMIGTNLSNRQFKRVVEDKVKETYERRLDLEIAWIIGGGR